MFVHHGGISSFEEGIFHAVPSMAMPVFGDQPSNAARLQRMGCGLRLNWADLTEEKLMYVHEKDSILIQYIQYFPLPNLKPENAYHVVLTT